MGEKPRFNKKFIKESALPEPQMIKQEMIGVYFFACNRWAKLNRGKMINKVKPRDRADFTAAVIDLFLKLRMKDCLQEYENDGFKFEDWQTKIMNGDIITLPEAFKLFKVLGDVLQILGVLKIEYIKEVPASAAYHEGRYLEGG